MDLVINEGFKKDRKPKIEILRGDRNSKPLCGDDDSLIALVTDTDTSLDVPTFGLEDIEALATMIEERYLSTETENLHLTRNDPVQLAVGRLIQE